ncbi:folylpolyglutamate synthase-like protein [Xylariales sp. PMI_506]|nr:folylpolyglutamate synthase-like protein [Xylariales sp. PMI_506]
MIELGLARIQKLLQRTPQTWKAIHVAGTNGKGSICAYLTAMFRANDISCAKFTSPHLVDRWDCISINDNAVSESKFRHFEELVKKRNDDWNVGATEFELLTATAFEIFEAERVEVGVVEVGLGGKLDATNSLKEKTVTIISKIGLDHQAFLGNTLAEIALQKAGIMREGVPCVVDASNPPSVLDVFQAHCKETGAFLKPISPESSPLVGLLQDRLEPHQAQNLAIAHTAFQLAYPQHAESTHKLAPAITNVTWPGRLQVLDISSLTDRSAPALLDGAHNPQSAEVLALYVDRHLRNNDASTSVTWVLAASQGKDLSEILKLLLRPGDSVSAVEFGPVDGMPWVKPMNTDRIMQAVADIPIASSYDAHSDLLDALQWANNKSNGNPLVIAGSLYLVSDVLKLLRAAGQ